MLYLSPAGAPEPPERDAGVAVSSHLRIGMRANRLCMEQGILFSWKATLHKAAVTEE